MRRFVPNSHLNRELYPTRFLGCRRERRYVLSPMYGDNYEANACMQCYCGNAIEPGTELAPDSDCEEKTCSGNATEYCGGTNRLSTYVLPRTYVPY